jgi:hypothetical protein
LTEEDKLILQRNKGVDADRELREVGSAFEEVKKRLVSAWMETNPRDEAGREKLWVATTILAQVETVLRTHVANGTVADKELERLKRAGEPKFRLRNINLI